MSSAYEKIHKEFITNILEQKPLEYYIDKYGIDHVISYHTKYFHQIYKEKNPSIKTYTYFTTFTLADPKNKDKLKSLITDNLPKRESLKIIKFQYTEEHVDSNYHIHTLYTTTRAIKKSHLKYYSRFGFIDHQPCKNEQDTLAYINKEQDSTVVI